MTHTKPRIPRAIWALGFVSLFMDVSSELIHSLLPIFMVSVLGASALALGFLEGAAEATASIVKMFSGALSDWLGKRKILAVAGYGISALTKPLFALAPGVGWVFTARIADRIGKGVRDAPRDALVAAIAPADSRGAAYGLRQALDTVGAFLGPGLAILLMALFAGNIRAVYWFAVVPAIVAVALLIAGVEEPDAPDEKRRRSPVSRAELAKLGGAYWLVVLVGGILTLARFSEAFLVLRAQSIGLSAMWVPATMVVMSVFYAAAAYPAGLLSDRIDRRTVLAAGVGLLVAADIVLALAGNVWWVMAGVALWGLHMGFSQGLLSTLVADTAPQELRGTAFGAFNFVAGIVLLLANALAGWLWTLGGPAFTFAAGAAFSFLALLGLLAIRAPRSCA